MSGSSKQEAPTEDTRASTQMPQSPDRGGSHCFAEIGGTVRAINRDAYAIFKDALDDLKE